MSLSRQELESINDQLQVQIAGLKAQLENAASPEIEEENDRLREENELLRSKLEETEKQRQELRETLTTKELGRQNELLQLEQDRKRIAELREMEVLRIGEEARRLADERAEMQETVTSARKAQTQAETREEGWRKQAQEAFQRMQTAEQEHHKALTRVELAESKVTRLERENSQALIQLQEFKNSSQHSLLGEMLDSLGSHLGCWVMALTILIAGMALIWLVSSIVSWLTQPARTPLGF